MWNTHQTRPHETAHDAPPCSLSLGCLAHPLPIVSFVWPPIWDRAASCHKGSVWMPACLSDATIKLSYLMIIPLELGAASCNATSAIRSSLQPFEPDLGVHRGNGEIGAHLCQASDRIPSIAASEHRAKGHVRRRRFAQISIHRGKALKRRSRRVRDELSTSASGNALANGRTNGCFAQPIQPQLDQWGRPAASIRSKITAAASRSPRSTRSMP